MLLRMPALLLLFFVICAQAGERYYLKKSETFCDSSGVLCLNGSLSYRVNPRILSLNARVQKKTGPGFIRIILIGANWQGIERFTEISISIRGTYSEIIDHSMRTNEPDVSEWEISSFRFQPAGD